MLLVCIFQNNPPFACKHPENQEAKQLLKNFDCSVYILRTFLFSLKKVSRQVFKLLIFFILPQPRFHVSNPTKPGNRGGLFG